MRSMPKEIFEKASLNVLSYRNHLRVKVRSQLDELQFNFISWDTVPFFSKNLRRPVELLSLWISWRWNPRRSN